MPFDSATYLKDTLAISPLIVTLLTSIVLLVISAGNNKWSGIPFVMGLGLAVSAVLAFLQIDSSFSAFSEMVIIGGISSVGILFVCLIGLLLVSVSKPILEKQNLFMGEFYVLVGFAITGMMMMVYANDLIMVFIGIETMSIPFYVLAALHRNNAKSNESGMKYFLIGSFATGFLLYGIALLYGATGSTKFLNIGASFIVNPTAALWWAGMAMLMIGFLFKVGAAPFHFWAPDVYQGAPTASAAFLATAGKTAAFITFATVAYRCIPIASPKWVGVVTVISILSMAVGNLTALSQSNIKRILGFSSVSHAGYLLIAFTTQSISGYENVVFYSLVYAIMTFMAFAVVGLLEGKDAPLTLETIKGLGFSRKFEAAILSVSLFSLMGLPPFGGFTAKYLIFVEAFKNGHITLVIIAVIASMISVYYYLKVITALYTKTDSVDEPVHMSKSVIAGLFGAFILLILTGIYPSLFLSHLTSLW